jgi:hypothetical protein
LARFSTFVTAVDFFFDFIPEFGVAVLVFGRHILDAADIDEYEYDAEIFYARKASTFK